MTQLLTFHPYANIFPLLTGAPFEALWRDIAEHGQREPILTYRGAIIDGRNRYNACSHLGLAMDTEEYSPDQDVTEAELLALIISLNLHRRHLDESQRAMIAAKIANMPKGTRTDLEPSANLQLVSQSGAATMLNVSERSVASAKKVQQEAEPEVVDAVEQGLLPVSVGASLADKPAEFQQAVVEKIQDGATPSAAIRETVRETVVEHLEDTKTREAKAIEGVYDVVVIDPPWPMEKIERDERPNQSEFDYPTMTEDQLKALAIPCADACHVWLWATQKYLPMALGLLKSWKLKYVCTFVWHKPGGFQPYGLPQFNCEFAIYARKGSPVFVDTKAFNLCFDAPRGGHSEKPEEFYDVVRRVTAGRRIDMFGRRAIEGFDSWGLEAPNA